MVQESVSREMGKVYGLIDKLNEAMARMSIGNPNVESKETPRPQYENVIPQAPPTNGEHNFNTYRRN